jgi:flagellar biosynthesis anti-sigma factor FlgM
MRNDEMTTINQNLPLGPNTAGELEYKTVKNDKAQDTEATTADSSLAKTNIAVSQDALTLSENVTEALQEAEFDHKKVEELRFAIARGAYPLDSMKIAEKFIELEKLL